MNRETEFIKETSVVLNFCLFFANTCKRDNTQEQIYFNLKLNSFLQYTVEWQISYLHHFLSRAIEIMII